MALAQATIGMLGGDGEVAGLIVAAIQKDILVASEEQDVAKKLVVNHQHVGPGSTLDMPYNDGVDFGAALGEATEVTHVVPDILDDTATMAKYTLDIPISMEAVQWGSPGALESMKQDVARAYSKKVAALIHAQANAQTDLDIDNAGAASTDLADFANAYKALASTCKAPGPYIMLLHPEHYTAIFGTATLTAAAANPTLLGGPSNAMYVGRIAGLETYVDPNCTGTGDTARSVFFAQQGLWWVWKNVDIPDGASGELGLEIKWRYDFRSYVVSATFVGAAVARRAAETTPWCGNIYNVA